MCPLARERASQGVACVRHLYVCVSCCAPRVGDRLVMEQLLVEVLEELTARELPPQEAAAVMQLAGGDKRRVAAADLADRGQQTMQDRENRRTKAALWRC